MNGMSIEQLESALLAVTSRLDLLDGVIKDARLGMPTTLAFHCNHSNLYFPADYVKEWGRLYGHGLGPDPVSEILDSDYDTAPPKITEDTRDFEGIMHPLVTTRVQVDLVKVPVIDYEAGRAVLAIDDPRLKARVSIIRPKQLANPKSRLRSLQAQWSTLNRGLTR